MTLEELGRRAVACKGWRWMPGMLIIDHGAGTRFLWEDEFYLHGMHEESEGSWMRIRKDRERHPDLTDPATLGCLLALVREAWGDEWLACLGSYSRDGATWSIYGGKPHGRTFIVRVAGNRYASEAEAIVRALEAAP